jgi:hypothetical protein
MDDDALWERAGEISDELLATMARLKCDPSIMALASSAILVSQIRIIAKRDPTTARQLIGDVSYELATLADDCEPRRH